MLKSNTPASGKVKFKWAIMRGDGFWSIYPTKKVARSYRWSKSEKVVRLTGTVSYQIAK